MDTFERRGTTISSQADEQRVDELRASVEAILVGGKTLLSEDPSLTVKSTKLCSKRKARGLEENPVKVAIVNRAVIYPKGNFLTKGPARCLVYTTSKTSPEQVHFHEKAGAQVFVRCEEIIDLRDFLRSLFHQGIQILMVEGGGTLIAGLFIFDLVDELIVYVSPKIFSGSTTPTLADGPGFPLSQVLNFHLDSISKFYE